MIRQEDLRSELDSFTARTGSALRPGPGWCSDGEDMEQYSILGRIGEGAHGIVFKAKHIEVTLLLNNNQQH